MDASSGHSAILAMQARKEWRAVNDGSGRDRISGDGNLELVRGNGPARMKLNSGLHPEILRNGGRVLHSGGSSSSSSLSDSDQQHQNQHQHQHHHPLANGSLEEVACQNGEDSKLYAEIQRMNDSKSAANGQMSSPSNGISLDIGASNSDHFAEPLEQQLHDAIRQREHYQRLEAELRAQFIARSEILRMQNSFDEQAKLNSSVISSLQEQLQDRENKLREMEQQLEERERQLRENKREASEAVNQVWAKDGLLREQTNELTTLRREKEKILADQKAAISQFEAERTQLLSQLHEMEEQLQEKERQFRELEEQHRTSQDALIYKEEQIRELQAWIQRAQEMDTFHANANSTLHAELRDRTEQMNQLWLGQQRQLAEVERYHLQTIQRLRLEVAEAREQNRLLKNGCINNVDVKTEQQSGLVHKENESYNSPEPSMGSLNKINQTVTAPSNQVENMAGLASSVTGGAGSSTMPASAVPVLHQFAGQPQGVPAAASQMTPFSLNQFSNPIIIQTQQQLIHQQALLQHSKQIQQPQSPQIRFPHPPAYARFPEMKPPPLSLQTRGINQQMQQVDQQGQNQLAPDQNVQKSAADFSQFSNTPVMQNVNLLPSMQQLQIRQHMLSQDANHISEQKHDHEKPQEECQDSYGQKDSPEQSELSHQDNQEVQQFRDVQNGRSFESTGNMQSIPKEQMPDVVQPSMDSIINHHTSHMNMDDTELVTQQQSSSQLIDQSANKQEKGRNEKPAEPNLLDEKALLACLVRAIPSDASCRIRISTTLPNRLGKMLAPLHWHDYKKRYGRLDEFISSHPKLFVVDGDFVHLREGAHAIISATTAVAKVAAATAMPLSNWPPAVAVTPVAHSHMQRSRKVVAPSMPLGSGGHESEDLMVRSLSILQRKV